jgi:hypothetical protein
MSRLFLQIIFTNHLFVLINEFLNGNHLEFDILMPIIQETSQKLTYLNPKLAQTGPASRNDLIQWPNIKQFYQTIRNY